MLFSLFVMMLKKEVVLMRVDFLVRWMWTVTFLRTRARSSSSAAARRAFGGDMR